MSCSPQQATEILHLHVLRLLGTTPDKAHVAVKGGCNLRFFFGSVRYSQDLDLDVTEQLAPHALKERLDRLFASAALRDALRAGGLELGTVSAPKQTETTQRWKAELRVRGRPVALHTKIECSRRRDAEAAVLEAVDPRVVQSYQMMPIVTRHYPLPAALRQKVRALVGRQTVQARDVFDLAVLFARAGGRVDAFAGMRGVLARAVERALEVSFDDFQGQVVAYLHPEHAASYASRDAWNALQDQVVDLLERARHERD
jgi:predicted nucleotidyltransferase component of viral defense system